MKKKLYEFKNISNNKAVIYVYGDIVRSKWSEEDVTASDFAKQLEQHNLAEEIEVRINSGGGNVFESFAIMNLLKNSKAKINVVIDGLAASGASIIAMAGDTITMNSGAVMMIHEASTGVYGNHDAFVKVVDLLDKLNSNLIDVYHERTGVEVEELKQMLNKETWLTATEALELGFCDEITELEVVACVDNDIVNINGVEFNKNDISNALEKIKISEKIENYAKKGSGQKMTEEELKVKHPEIYNSIKEKGINEERQRIKNIEDGTLNGCEELSYKAKFEEPMNQTEFLMAVVSNQKAKGAKFLNQLDDESEETHVDIIPQNGAITDDAKAKEDNVIFNMVKEMGGSLNE